MERASQLWIKAGANGDEVFYLFVTALAGIGVSVEMVGRGSGFIEYRLSVGEHPEGPRGAARFVRELGDDPD